MHASVPSPWSTYPPPTDVRRRDTSPESAPPRRRWDPVDSKSRRCHRPTARSGGRCPDRSHGRRPRPGREVLGVLMAAHVPLVESAPALSCHRQIRTLDSCQPSVRCTITPSASRYSPVPPPAPMAMAVLLNLPCRLLFHRIGIAHIPRDLVRTVWSDGLRPRRTSSVALALRKGMLTPRVPPPPWPDSRSPPAAPKPSAWS